MSYSRRLTSQISPDSKNPVRTLHLQCAVCSHGGHRECYHKYYVQRPPEEIPLSQVPQMYARTRGSIIMSASASAENEGGAAQATRIISGMKGHRCAAGCGHFCWIV